MQAGRVDILKSCEVCGANLASDRAETCGSRRCAWVRRIRIKIAARIAVDESLADAELRLGIKKE
jgi:hypothetical protein